MRSSLVSLGLTTIAFANEASDATRNDEFGNLGSQAKFTHEQRALFQGDDIARLSQQAALTDRSRLASVDDLLSDDHGNTKHELLPLTFIPLPLGSTTPTPNSWLASELSTSIHGLAGNLHTFYRYIKDSPWTGGNSEYAPLNEGFPYWFNGAVALAYSQTPSSSSEQATGEEQATTPTAAALKAAVHAAATTVLSRQSPDGWLGPETGRARLLWARFPLLLGLTNLADANASWVEPVEDALVPFVKLMHTMLEDDYRGYKWHEGDEFGEFDTTWGRVRYADALISLAWLYERSTGERFSREHGGRFGEVIWECMEMLREGSLSWNEWYVEDKYMRRNGGDVSKEEMRRLRESQFHYMHGVNVGQGLKAPAVDRRQTHNASLVQTALNAVNWTYLHHGAASGTILADEKVVGLDPWSGSELCTTLETLFSLSYLHHSLGHAHFASHAETLSYNALPASFTPDHWAHQYMTQPNQPWSRELTANPFSTVGTRAQVFGLEPQYPCCTTNLPQGWPRVLMASYARTRKNDDDEMDDGAGGGGRQGIVHALLGPARVVADLPTTSEEDDGKGKGNRVEVSCVTEYPFEEVLRYDITAERAFDFSVRVPDWTILEESSISFFSSQEDTTTTNSTNPSIQRTLNLEPSPKTSLHTLALLAGKSTITYTLSARIRTVPRAHDTIAIYRGALLYALDIGVKEKTSPPHDFRDPEELHTDAPPQVRDYTMENTTPWNYAVDPGSLTWVPPAGLPNARYGGGDSAAGGARAKGSVFAPGRAELGSIKARACRIEWGLLDGATPGAPPPREGGKRRCVGPVEEVRLVPYGSVALHMAELPVMDVDGDRGWAWDGFWSGEYGWSGGLVGGFSVMLMVVVVVKVM